MRAALITEFGQPLEITEVGQPLEITEVGDDAAPAILMDPIIMGEIELPGSRGMPATDYPRVLELVTSGIVDLRPLVTKAIPLDDSPVALAAMGTFTGAGTTVIDRFR